jgi:hypothetical protein
MKVSYFWTFGLFWITLRSWSLEVVPDDICKPEEGCSSVVNQKSCPLESESDPLETAFKSSSKLGS